MAKRYNYFFIVLLLNVFVPQAQALAYLYQNSLNPVTNIYNVLLVPLISLCHTWYNTYNAGKKPLHNKAPNAGDVGDRNDMKDTDRQTYLVYRMKCLEKESLADIASIDHITQNIQERDDALQLLDHIDAAKKTSDKIRYFRAALQKNKYLRNYIPASYHYNSERKQLITSPEPLEKLIANPAWLPLIIQRMRATMLYNKAREVELLKNCIMHPVRPSDETRKYEFSLFPTSTSNEVNVISYINMLKKEQEAHESVCTPLVALLRNIASERYTDQRFDQYKRMTPLHCIIPHPVHEKIIKGALKGKFPANLDLEEYTTESRPLNEIRSNLQNFLEFQKKELQEFENNAFEKE
jgi:hypothetical protein